MSNESDKISLNLMVLGATGVGKSSLINYLTKSECAKVGVGKPVTQQDFLNYIIPMNDEIEWNIFDSWGLEADKSEEWKHLIGEKIYNVTVNKRNDSESRNYDDDFCVGKLGPLGGIWRSFLLPILNYVNIKNADGFIHGIIYCISYSSARIQDFDLEMIKFLLSLKYHVIIAFTHADDRAFKKKQVEYHSRISTCFENELKYLSLVDVSVKSSKKLGQQRVSKPFGREMLLGALGDAVVESYIYVAMKRWENIAFEGLAQVKRECSLKIDEFKKESIFATKVQTATKINEEVCCSLNAFSHQIKNDIDGILEKWRVLQKYYRKYLVVDECIIDLDDTSGRQYGLDDEFAIFVIKCIPILNVFMFFLQKSILKDDLYSVLNSQVVKIEEAIASSYDKIVFEANKTIQKILLAAPSDIE